MAKLVGYSAPYWCDIEKNRKKPPYLDRLEVIAGILLQSEEEKTVMMDLTGDQRNTVGPNLLAYIKKTIMLPLLCVPQEISVQTGTIGRGL